MPRVGCPFVGAARALAAAARRAPARRGLRRKPSKPPSRDTVESRATSGDSWSFRSFDLTRVKTHNVVVEVSDFNPF
eukprot:1694785-Prymnesium_polylepis.1